MDKYMHIHILGICGTFMGGIAMIAKQAGFKVTGADLNVYPPMSDELLNAGIELIQGYGAEQLDLKPDLIVVGNVMKRGMPVIERMLNGNLSYVSGPQWLEEHYLRHKTVLAVAGTHGKTTTSSMLAWILEQAGLNPGFLIGGIPENFGVSARNTDSSYFVIEADEYDCAFFDKRSKFVHYHPKVLVMNNLEYDHADIFDSVRDIQKQFHHLVRTVPGEGTVILPEGYKTLEEVLEMGCWSNVVKVGGASLKAKSLNPDCSHFEITGQGIASPIDVTFPCIGRYSVDNALMAVAAAQAVGVKPEIAASALQSFKLPKRRMELKGIENNVAVYDDFAHHPTAIRVTLGGLRARLGNDKRLVAVFEPRSNSMKMGANHDQLAGSFEAADEIFVYDNNLPWNVDALETQCRKPLHIIHDFDALVKAIVGASPAGTTVLVMSNGSFNGLHGKLLEALKKR